MKTTRLIFALLVTGTLLFSCTPQALTDDATDTPNTFATGGESESDVDNDRD